MRKRGGLGGRILGDECAQCQLAPGWGFPQLCVAVLTNSRLYEAISLTHTHYLNRKIDGKNGKVRADSSAALHRKYRTATDLSLTLSSLTHTYTQSTSKGMQLKSTHTNVIKTHPHSYIHQR